jgi:molybdate transport system substrate-binding protein
MKPISLITLLILSLTSGKLFAAEATLAVAANFTGTMQRIAPLFEQATGHTLTLTFGSTGKLYAQITNGAPFDLFMSADAITPARLEEKGLAVPGTQFTYAMGKLVLWSPEPGIVDDAGEFLKEDPITHLAIVNPKLAPYGAAAIATLESMGVMPALESKLVIGENLTQAYQFIVSGNATAGFIALSQILKGGKFSGGSWWIVPAEHYTPLRQDAVLLKRGEKNAAALALLEFMKSPPALEIIQGDGYGL